MFTFFKDGDTLEAGIEKVDESMRKIDTGGDARVSWPEENHETIDDQAGKMYRLPHL